MDMFIYIYNKKVLDQTLYSAATIIHQSLEKCWSINLTSRCNILEHILNTKLVPEELKSRCTNSFLYMYKQYACKNGVVTAFCINLGSMSVVRYGYHARLHIQDQARTENTKLDNYIWYCHLILQFIRSAIGGGADLVGNVDTTLAGKPSGKVRIESGNVSGGGFQAIASGLAVRGGLCGVVQSSNPTTAAGRHCSTSPHVVNAWCQAGTNLATCHGLSNC